MKQAQGPVAAEISRKLQALNPTHLLVVDESDKHKGHAGHSGLGESHFRVEITADAFVGKSRIEQHRMVNDLLADLLKGPIHALALKTTPL